MRKFLKIIATVILLMSVASTVVSANYFDNWAYVPVNKVISGNSDPTGQYGSIQAFAISVNGDVNGDGKVDSLDAAQVLKRDAGIITEFANKEYDPTLTPEEESAICQGFWEGCINESGSYESGFVEVLAYYGKYNDWAVAYITGLEDNGYYHINILNGYVFHYGSGNEDVVVKGTEVYELWEAYESGLLTDEDIYKIAIQQGTVPADLWTDSNEVWIPEEDGTYSLVYNIFGDANNDRKVDSLDAAWILKYDAGLVE